MFKKLIFTLATLLVLALIVYCGGSDNKIDFGDTQIQDSITLVDTGNDGNTNICNTCKADQICAYEKVCVSKPTEEAKATQDSANNVFVDPNFSCISDSPTKPQGPEKVKIKGCVDAFGISGNTVEAKITFYKEEDILQYGECIKEKGVGSCKMPNPIVPEVVSYQDTNCDDWGAYEVENIPTNTMLVRLVRLEDFHDSYQFNVYFPADKDKNGDGIITTDEYPDAAANGVSNSTWNLIPRTIGLLGITKGNGVIAGRVRDCEQYPVMNATVGTDGNPKMLVYFNGDDGKVDDAGKPKSSDPDPQRKATNSDGLYSIVDIKPGNYNVVALVQNNNQILKLGYYTVTVFPDAATILTFRESRAR
ncbi:MAG: carboxypeptidase-like regulatory domain-containing protein [Deltaproteobacteria bacterium]|nr:carboxypeptidase-like regulatory domain-containing protein [Deltaproteobacteria bacterium]